MTARSCGEMPGPVSVTLSEASGALASDADDDLTALRELDRVVDEVAEDLTDAPSVDACDERRLALDAHGELLLADETARLAHHLVREAREVDATARELQLTALERRELEDVVDEREEVRARAADLLDLLAGRRRERAVDLLHEDVGEAEDGVERAAQLVADGGEEGGALAVGGARAREVLAIRLLGLSEAADQLVERGREEPDLVHRARGNELAGRLGADLRHAVDASRDEVDVARHVAGDGVGDGRGDAEEHDREREERGDESGRALCDGRLRDEHDETWRVPCWRRSGARRSVRDRGEAARRPCPPRASSRARRDPARRA